MGLRDRSDGAARFFSLRWKALIALSLLLLVVNASLAFFAYRQALGQFELQQSDVRRQQDRQLRAMVAERFEEMARLAPLVPLMGPSPPLRDLSLQLDAALQANGSMVNVEWDILSVHWIGAQGHGRLTWPERAQSPPGDLLALAEQEPEQRFDLLSCRPECRQYVASPLLGDGSFAGTLILARSLADALLAFNELTGAEVAVIPQRGRDPADTAGVVLEFPAITHSERSLPIIREALQMPGLTAEGTGIARVERPGAWYEVFRIDALEPGVDALVVNDVTAQRAAITRATRLSIAIGLIGLILSEALLLVLLNQPLLRLRRIAHALPLLAENRYQDLRARLVDAPTQGSPSLTASWVSPQGPVFGWVANRSAWVVDQLRGLWGRLRPKDEMDMMMSTVGNLTDRMENLQTDRENAEANLAWLADHDSLTQLYNRRRFDSDFARAMDQALRFGHSGAVLFFDLDQFKDVNDISGHQVGDRLLQQVAEKLRGLSRPSDILARLGGDEFAWVLPESSSGNAVAIAERTQDAIRSISVNARGRRHQVSASIGIVLFPEQGRDTHQVMANADLAMYQAKEKGRGRWHLFSPEDQARERADARVVWREQIADALHQDRFELVFQPIVDVKSGRTGHFEALLRLRDTHGGLVYPDRFIPVAEKTGQIQAIDHWVLGRALGLMRRCPELRLSVNLSANAMDDPLLLPDLERLLRHFGVEPQRLAFEVTETAAINSVLQATRLMRGIQELGCRFALDDFGSGYASYAYLRQLPVDDVKVDGCFIRNLAESREDRIFVKAITDMSHGMGKRVIAEFVESDAILRVLRELGVDCAQGYLFGRPAPLVDCGAGLQLPRAVRAT